MPEDSPGNTPPADGLAKRRPNVPIWLGFLLAVFAFLSYIPIFARYPSTRDMPWANFLLFAAALAFLFVGLRRAFGQSDLYRGKIAGPILTTLSVAMLALFCLFTFSLGKHLPASAQAPKIGQKAPDFSLSDTNGTTVTLASLLSTPIAVAQPTKGVVLIFYRGYW
jgi:hypothetical protein